jgi:hypothetical protein
MFAKHEALVGVERLVSVRGPDPYSLAQEYQVHHQGVYGYLYLARISMLELRDAVSLSLRKGGIGVG